MKRILFGLGAVTVVCACGLVIDPDKLVEGNGTPIDTGDGGPDTSTGQADGGDGSAIDGGTDGSGGVEVPECVPPLPSTTGAKGPYAIVTVAKGAAAACPPGYLATAIEQGDGEFKSAPAECNNAAGCTCGNATGTAKCGLRINYYNDSQCTDQTGSTTSFSQFLACPVLNDKDYLRLESMVSGISCPASGSTPPTAKPPPAFGKTTIVCAPDPNVKTAQCKGTDVPLPAAKDAEACIVVPVSESCSGDYGSTRLLSKGGAFTDNRSCTCGCTGNPATSCNGGKADTWPGLSCSGSMSTELNAGNCRARGGHLVAQVSVAPTVSASASCSARATPAGEALPTIDLKLCCIGNGG